MIGYVYRLKPKICFIEGGVNDLPYDGIHLNARGYALWAPEVARVLAKHNL